MNKFLTLLSILFIIYLLISSFSIVNPPVEKATGFEIPKNIDTIFSNSCYSCHNVESKNYKAKMKLKLDELGTMKLSKLVSKLNKIAKEVEKGDMPTKKFAANYPDKMPSDEDKNTLINWARNSAKELAGE